MAPMVTADLPGVILLLYKVSAETRSIWRETGKVMGLGKPWDVNFLHPFL